MLTFKKAAVLAVFVVCVFFLSTSNHGVVKDPDLPVSPSQETSSDSGGNRVESAQVTGSPSPSDQDLLNTVVHAAPNADSLLKDVTQQTLTDVKTGDLHDALLYQFPYDRAGKFPAFIWQTWKTTPGGDFPDAFRPAEASWSVLHPGFTHEVVTDSGARLLLRYLYASIPDVIEAYDALPLPVMKADFFRYLILLARGGIYTDIDTTALRSTTDWIPDEVPRSTIGLVIGIEADPDRPDWKDWYSRRIQFCQWTIQAKPGHPVLRDAVARITEMTLERKRQGTLKAEKLHNDIVEFTGPAMWTDVVFAYLNNKDYFKLDSKKNISWSDFTRIETAKKIGDVVVLPITSFSPGVQNMGAKEPEDPMAFVKHDFEGKQYKLMGAN